MGKTCQSTHADINKLRRADEAAHDWYRFVLSYPPHLVRSYVDSFSLEGDRTVMDPFCGTGTTVVECKKLGIPAVGIEAHPMAHFASSVKVSWDVDPDELLSASEGVAEATLDHLDAQGISDNAALLMPPEETDGLRTLSSEQQRLILKNSISPLPLHKTLVLLEKLREQPDGRFLCHQKLALARALVDRIGNLHFGPEVGVGEIQQDAPVVHPWLGGVRRMCRDLKELQDKADVPARVHCGDARGCFEQMDAGSVDAVITSPPYPNEKDYTRTMRLESVLLGFMRDRKDLRRIKRTLLRSNTRGVYKGDDDDAWVEDFPEIQRIAEKIEARRVELGKTSGFERTYPRVTKLYFGGMARHFADLRRVLSPGAQLAYVVGDQASYLRVTIRTGQILAKIAESLGYEVTDIDLFRTRWASATREELREEVLLLRWPGTRTGSRQ